MINQNQKLINDDEFKKNSDEKTSDKGGFHKKESPNDS